MSENQAPVRKPLLLSKLDHVVWSRSQQDLEKILVDLRGPLSLIEIGLKYGVLTKEDSEELQKLLSQISTTDAETRIRTSLIEAIQLVQQERVPLDSYLIFLTDDLIFLTEVPKWRWLKRGTDQEITTFTVEVFFNPSDEGAARLWHSRGVITFNIYMPPLD